MLNSKERATLRGIASTIDATVIVGKDGLTENVLKQIEDQLYVREMVKISVLDGADLSARDYLHEVASKLSAEEVCSIGRKFVVYKLSNKKGIKHISYK